jgi:hypothetical protein
VGAVDGVVAGGCAEELGEGGLVMEDRTYKIIIAVLALVVGILAAALASPSAYGLRPVWNDLGNLFISLFAFLFAYIFALKASQIAIDMQRRTKLAEFCQSWINDLRTDVAEFISVNHAGVDKTEMAERHNAILARIILRLKPGRPIEEEFSIVLRELSHSDGADEFLELADKVVTLVRPYLKAEWDVIKDELAGIK